MSDNELIARFLGGVTQKATSYSIHDYPNELPKHILKDLKYHKSWDWLMPVWIKFRNLEFSEDSQSDHDHRDWINSLQWYLFSSDEPKRFAERMVFAIKWYNSQKS